MRAMMSAMSHHFVMLVVDFLLMCKFFICTPEWFEVSIVDSCVPALVMVGWRWHCFVEMRLVVACSVVVFSLPVFMSCSKVW